MNTEYTKTDMQAALRIMSHTSLLCSVISDQINARDTTDEELLLQSHFQKIGMLSDHAQELLGSSGFRDSNAAAWLVP